MNPVRSGRARVRGGTAALLIATLTVTACASTPPLDLPSSPESARLTWRACADAANWESVPLPPERREQLDIGCAELSLPVDVTDPSAGALTLALVRVRSRTQRDRLGSLVLNPGGPGASGLDAMPSWAESFPDALLQRFDLVSFDPRGTGASSPIDCPDPGTSEQQSLLTSAGYSAARERTRAWEAACAAALGPTAALFGTEAVARDLDAIRQAIGDARLSFIGLSYGARLGAHYAHLFPDRVGLMVLDAPPDPRSSSVRAIDAQIDGFEAAFARYADDCSQRPTCVQLLGRPRAALRRLVEEASARSIPSGRPAHDPPATPEVIVRAVLSFMSDPASWRFLDMALDEALRGDSGSLYDRIDALEGRSPAHPDRDSDDAQLVIRCIDNEPPASADYSRQTVQAFVREHPVFGELTGPALFACTGWPDASRSTLPAPRTSASSPILVIGGEADPNTPLVGAQALVAAMGPSAVLIRSALPGHTAFLRSPCVTDTVTSYLLGTAVPSPGTRCG